MSFISIDPLPAEPSGLTTTVPGNALSSDLVAKGVIDTTQMGTITREVLTWRTPHLGYVKMYLNPQQMSTDDGKDITPARTKGGFVIHYAGENLTVISLTGTTGSAGIEGINILESVYRSEQEAFGGIALALEERLSVLQMGSITGLNSLLDPNLLRIASDSIRNFGRPQPTLASLAANIELFFQGVVYRGFFTKFTVTESAPESGHFNYNIVFTAYAKQGTRRNFMPWHRQPLNPANTHDSGVNPLSFPNIIERVLPDQRESPAEARLTNFTTIPNVPTQRSDRIRSTNTAADRVGQNITQTDLRG